MQNWNGCLSGLLCLRSHWNAEEQHNLWVWIHSPSVILRSCRNEGLNTAVAFSCPSANPPLFTQLFRGKSVRGWICLWRKTVWGDPGKTNMSFAEITCSYTSNWVNMLLLIPKIHIKYYLPNALLLLNEVLL